MGLKLKCVSIVATLECTKAKGTTTFVKKANIIKVEGIELATKDNTDVNAFTGKCDKKDKCKPSLEQWKFIAVNKGISKKELLTELSICKCSRKEDGYVTIKDTKQKIVTIDLYSLIFDSLEALLEMLNKKLSSDNFDKCFDKWFGNGHDKKQKKMIRNRIKDIESLITSKYLKDGKLQKKYFRFDNDPEYFDTFAYVYSTDTGNLFDKDFTFWNDHIINFTPDTFTSGASLSGFNSVPGVIAHEGSHFLDMGDTDDKKMKDENGKILLSDDEGNVAIAYGVDAALMLAEENKDAALYNADNFEYFLEDEDCE